MPKRSDGTGTALQHDDPLYLLHCCYRKVRNTEGKSTDVKQPLPIPMNVSEWAIGNGYTVGSEPGSLLLVLLMAAAVLLNVWYQNSKKKPAFSKERAQDEK